MVSGFDMFLILTLFLQNSAANEAEVGHAIRDSGIPRSEVFVTTKLWYLIPDFCLRPVADLTSGAPPTIACARRSTLHSKLWG
jgi:hypothetical protein